MDLKYLRKETRYGVPAADKVLFNRHYVIGYSYYFRQAKWALEIVDNDKTIVERADNFRPDFRLPQQFRADLADYKRSGYDRGHLVASANQIETDLQNSETFLLSNMSPQFPKFNRDIWRKLEYEIRDLNSRNDIFETYVISGPIFDFNKRVEVIGTNDDNDVSIPIPHYYFKSVLTENSRGKIDIWSFIIPNTDCNQDIERYIVSTKRLEKLAGFELWENLRGDKMEKMKSELNKIW